MAAKSFAGVGDSERRISSWVSESSEWLEWWRWWAEQEIKAEGGEERERERRVGKEGEERKEGEGEGEE